MLRKAIGIGFGSLLTLGLLTPAGPASAATADGSPGAGTTREIVHQSDRCTSVVKGRWLHNPYCVDQQTTGTGPTRTHAGRTIEIRYGQYRGVQYGWARLTGSYSPNDRIIFRVRDGGNYYARDFRASTRTYSRGYQTSHSGNRRFRACMQINATGDHHCTKWW